MVRESVRVLVVDDDEGVRTGLQIRLSEAGFKVRTASSGEDALLACTPEPPEVIILDVAMPGIDGFEVCTRIRHSLDQPVAVIFLTGTTHAGTSSHLEQLVNQSGGDYFLAKPYDATLLIDLIDQIQKDAAASSAI